MEYINEWLKTPEFRDFEKIILEFSGDSKENDLKKLDKIFVDNPNCSWTETATYYNLYTRDPEDLLKFLNMLKEEKVSFYRYKYELPNKPNSVNDKEILYILSDWSRAKSELTLNLYWLAYNFFNKRGYTLTSPYGASTYLRVKKGDALLGANSSWDDEKYDNYLDEDKIIDKTLVRCGNIDANRIMHEIACGLDSLWIFPHFFKRDIIERKYLNCYLMTVNP